MTIEQLLALLPTGNETVSVRESLLRQLGVNCDMANPSRRKANELREELESLLQAPKEEPKHCEPEEDCCEEDCDCE